MTDPVLSLVIPAYNEESRLPTTLTRVSEALERHGEPYEVLVVVNGSTDRTAEVAKAAAHQDPNVRVILTPRRGKGLAVRLGVLDAQGLAHRSTADDLESMSLLCVARDDASRRPSAPGHWLMTRDRRDRQRRVCRTKHTTCWSCHGSLDSRTPWSARALVLAP